jgi:hypothetical protein
MPVERYLRYNAPRYHHHHHHQYGLCVEFILTAFSVAIAQSEDDSDIRFEVFLLVEGMKKKSLTRSLPEANSVLKSFWTICLNQTQGRKHSLLESLKIQYHLSLPPQ